VKKVKLLIADKYEIFREGLAKLLENEPSIEVVCACCTEWEAAAHKYQPDVILIDIELSECSGIEVMQHIYKMLPKTKIMAFTHSKVNTDFFSAFKVGARAYISKGTSLENLIKAITLVAEGEVIISPPMATRLLTQFSYLKESKEIVKSADDIILSKREQAVLPLVAQGFTNREIAATLYISEHTVKVHLRNIMEKLHAHTRQQAVVLARGKDLLSGTTETDANPM